MNTSETYENTFVDPERNWKTIKRPNWAPEDTGSNIIWVRNETGEEAIIKPCIYRPDQKENLDAVKELAYSHFCRNLLGLNFPTVSFLPRLEEDRIPRCIIRKIDDVISADDAYLKIPKSRETLHTLGGNVAAGLFFGLCDRLNDGNFFYTASNGWYECDATNVTNTTMQDKIGDPKLDYGMAFDGNEQIYPPTIIAAIRQNPKNFVKTLERIAAISDEDIDNFFAMQGPQYISKASANEFTAFLKYRRDNLSRLVENWLVRPEVSLHDILPEVRSKIGAAPMEILRDIPETIAQKSVEAGGAEENAGFIPDSFAELYAFQKNPDIKQENRHVGEVEDLPTAISGTKGVLIPFYADTVHAFETSRGNILENARLSDKDENTIQQLDMCDPYLPRNAENRVALPAIRKIAPSQALGNQTHQEFDSLISIDGDRFNRIYQQNRIKDQTQKDPSSNCVPTNAWSIWFTGKEAVPSAHAEIPFSFLRNAAKFIELNPGWTYTIATDDPHSIQKSIREFKGNSQLLDESEKVTCLDPNSANDFFNCLPGFNSSEETTIMKIDRDFIVIDPQSTMYKYFSDLDAFDSSQKATLVRVDEENVFELFQSKEHVFVSPEGNVSLYKAIPSDENASLGFDRSKPAVLSSNGKNRYFLKQNDTTLEILGRDVPSHLLYSECYKCLHHKWTINVTDDYEMNTAYNECLRPELVITQRSGQPDEKRWSITPEDQRLYVHVSERYSQGSPPILQQKDRENLSNIRVRHWEDFFGDAFEKKWRGFSRDDKKALHAAIKMESSGYSPFRNPAIASDILREVIHKTGVNPMDPSGGVYWDGDSCFEMQLHKPIPKNLAPLWGILLNNPSPDNSSPEYLENQLIATSPAGIEIIDKALLKSAALYEGGSLQRWDARDGFRSRRGEEGSFVFCDLLDAVRDVILDKHKRHPIWESYAKGSSEREDNTDASTFLDDAADVAGNGSRNVLVDCVFPGNHMKIPSSLGKWNHLLEWPRGLVAVNQLHDRPFPPKTSPPKNEHGEQLGVFLEKLQNQSRSSYPGGYRVTDSRGTILANHVSYNSSTGHISRTDGSHLGYVSLESKEPRKPLWRRAHDHKDTPESHWLTPQNMHLSEWRSASPNVSSAPVDLLSSKPIERQNLKRARSLSSESDENRKKQKFGEAMEIDPNENWMEFSGEMDFSIDEPSYADVDRNQGGRSGPTGYDSGR